MRRGALLAGLLLAVLTTSRSGVAADCEFATLAEARAMTERAAVLFEQSEPVEALRAFMDPAGSFIDRDLYVFVIDLNGIVWANGAFPWTVGTTAHQARDTTGRYFVREMIRLANERGEGWVEYDLINPCTGKLTPKTSFIKRVGPFIVGVGAYGTVST